MSRRRLGLIILWIIAVSLPLAVAERWISGESRPWRTQWDPQVGGYSLDGNGWGLIVWRHEVGSQQPPTLAREYPGFRVHRSAWGNASGQLGSSVAVAIYYRWLLPIASLPLLLLIGGRLLRRRTRPGYCPDCGYDLRATPDRCPECGRSTR